MRPTNQTSFTMSNTFSRSSMALRYFDDEYFYDSLGICLYTRQLFTVYFSNRQNVIDSSRPTIPHTMCGGCCCCCCQQARSAQNTAKINNGRREMRTNFSLFQPKFVFALSWSDYNLWLVQYTIMTSDIKTCLTAEIEMEISKRM